MTRTQKLLLTSILAAGCGDGPAPPPAPPPEPTGWESAAAMDRRTPVPLTPMMAEHQKEMRRDHLLAVSEITSAVTAEDWAAIEAASARLGSSPESSMMCEHMGAGAPGFTERGIAFHATADGIGTAARAKDREAVLTALSSTLSACTSCHAQFRQDVMAEAAYSLATGSGSPKHGQLAPTTPVDDK